jgi:nitrogen fixation NifU-like protein
MNHNLYQQMILDHSKNPKGYVKNPQGCCEKAYNPLCGDSVHICLKQDNEIISHIEFSGEGCSLSIAAASILVSIIVGKSKEDFFLIKHQFLQLVKGHEAELPNKLQVFSNISHYPMRVKCVTMVWHAVSKALEEVYVPS